MCSVEALKIDLKAVGEGRSSLHFDLSDDYFEAIAAPELSRGNVHVEVEILNAQNVFTFDFHLEGMVIVPCDLCLDDMEQPITADNRLTARFGDEESEDDELVIVPEDEPVLDLSWLIYEQIVLAIPIKHVHAPGKCNDVMTQKLKELSAARSSDESETAVDPRWEKLKNLKI